MKIEFIVEGKPRARAQGSQFPEPATVSNFNPVGETKTYVEVWIPRSWLPDSSYRAHFRYSPNTYINYIWKNPGVNVHGQLDWRDATKYGQITFD